MDCARLLLCLTAGMALAGLTGGCGAGRPARGDANETVPVFVKQTPPPSPAQTTPSPETQRVYAPPETVRAPEVNVPPAPPATPAPASASAAPEPASPPGRFIGWSTNGPAVFANYLVEGAPRPAGAPSTAATNSVFHHYLPDSLSHLIWTNFIAHTNGRNTRIWSVRSHPPGWPNRPPVVQWNTNGLMWGMKGLTGLSPCWEMEVNSGQVPVTALTRRHGYTRGHSMGPDGFRTSFAGKRVWFLDAANRIVEVKVAREVVRVYKVHKREDYTLLLFDRDLPPGIEPLRVTDEIDTWKRLGMPALPYNSPAPRPVFLTEQGGHVSAGIPGFIVPTGKGGDSGSPNLLPLPGELVFFGGRMTTGPTADMQRDMDELCRLEGLDPARYPMQWVDLSAYPTSF